MQLFAHSFFNNAGLFFLMQSNHKQENAAEGKSAFSQHKKESPSFTSAPSARLRRRQQVRGSRAKHAPLNFAPSLSRDAGNLSSRFRISASISLSLPPPELSLPGPHTAIQMLRQPNAVFLPLPKPSSASLAAHSVSDEKAKNFWNTSFFLLIKRPGREQLPEKPLLCKAASSQADGASQSRTSPRQRKADTGCAGRAGYDCTDLPSYYFSQSNRGLETPTAKAKAWPS